MKGFEYLRCFAAVAVCVVSGFAISVHATPYNQSTNTTTITSGSIACANAGRTTDNSYYRVYTPSAFGAVGNVSIQSVRFGVEQSTVSNQLQPVTIRLYTSSNGLPTGTLTQIASSTVNVPAGSFFFKVANIAGPSLPATTPIIVELFSPDGTASANSFFIGSNSLGQSGPGYIKAATCGIPTPATFASLGFPNVHIHLSVDTTAATSAAGVSVSGRVLAGPSGRGLTNAVVTLIDKQGNTRSVKTGRNGSFLFDDLDAGSDYVVSVKSIRFSFSPKVITVRDAMTGVEFVPDE